jgi:hypothetical protein
MCEVSGVGAGSSANACAAHDGNSTSAQEQVAAVARSDDLKEIVDFGAQHPELRADLEDALIAERNYDGFHALNTGVTDRGVIDWAQEVTANGGCAALARDTYFLCNPNGTDIGEFTIPKIAEMPGVISPDAPNWHQYHASASSIDTSEKFAAAALAEMVRDPTPGDDAPATVAGTQNAAGVPGANLFGLDQVFSYVSRDTAGNPVVANVTIPGEHVLTPGIVSQGVRTDATGTHLTVVGEGNAPNSDWWFVNEMARSTFQGKIDGDLIQATLQAAQ